MPGLCGRVALLLLWLLLYFTVGVHIMLLLRPDDVPDVLLSGFTM